MPRLLWPHCERRYNRCDSVPGHARNARTLPPTNLRILTWYA
jgi:hypothetical protein